MSSETLALIACTKRKASTPVAAREMYWPSTLFRLCYQQAESEGLRIAILSALHGLLLPDDVISPYNKTVKEMSSEQRVAWAERIGKQFDQRLASAPVSDVVFLASNAYREPVMPVLQKRGIRCRVHSGWTEICSEAFA